MANDRRQLLVVSLLVRAWLTRFFGLSWRLGIHGITGVTGQRLSSNLHELRKQRVVAERVVLAR